LPGKKSTSVSLHFFCFSLSLFCYSEWVTSAKKPIYKIKKLIREYFDMEEEEEKRIYSKYFDNTYKSSLKIVMELIDSHWEIKSIHFKKNKKAR